MHLAVHVVEGKLDELGSADAGGVQGLDDGPVADAELAVQPRLGEDALHFIRAQDGLGQTPMDLG